MSDLRLSKAELAELRRRPLTGRNKIAAALHIKDATQSALALALGGLPHSQVSELVNGKYLDIKLEATARRVATVFGACIEDLFPPACATKKRAA